ncbi:MAG: hypothetical protein NTY53_20580 [Kiritimatiellaeota bacterium]|nr:hypothetical protein [Kiritimatiellota bacterium]
MFLRLCIAGLELEIAARDFGLICEPSSSNPEYREFVYPSVLSPDIRIHLTIGDCPGSSFHSLNSDVFGPQWFSDNGKRRVFTRNAFKQLNWDCIFETPLRHAEVFIPVSQVCCKSDGRSISNPVIYPLDQLLLMYHMASRQGAIFHAAGAFREGHGALFLGRSRAGKSTVSRQLDAHGGFRVVSDDRIIVRKLAEGYAAFGTPWPGEAKIARNESAPLAALFFLHKSPDNRIVPLKPQLAFERMLPVASIPWFDPDVFPLVLEYLEKLSAEVPAFDLHFKPTPEIADDIDRVLRSVHGA